MTYFINRSRGFDLRFLSLESRIEEVFFFEVKNEEHLSGNREFIEENEFL